MSEPQRDIGGIVLGIASAVRRCVIEGNLKLAHELEKSDVDPTTGALLIKFATMLMEGEDREVIIERLHIPDTTLEILDNIGIYDW